MKQTCILVLGMHRSGTSAMTGTLELLDVDLGSNLMQADGDNAKGYFENNNFYAINEHLLSQINSSWEDLFFDPNKLNNISDTDKLTEVLQKEFKESSIFAIKDPRLVYLFPIYEKALKKLGIEIKIIIPYRNPVEVASSLTKRNDFSPEKGMLLWAYHILLAEKFSRGYDRLFVNFDELISSTADIIQLISKKLNIDFNLTYNTKKTDIATFLDPGIKHHNTSIDDILHDTPIIVTDILKQRNNFNEPNISDLFDLLVFQLFSYQKLFYNQDIINIVQELPLVKKELAQTVEKNRQELQNTEQILHNTQQQLQNTEQILHEKEQYIHHLEELVQSLRLKNRLKRLVPKKIRELFHISKHSLKHPFKLFQVMDRQYAIKLWRHVKRGNFSYILERMSHYLNQEVSTIHLDLMTEYNTEDILTFPKTATPKVSIVIPVYNQFHFTHRCLRSILQFTNDVEYEIIIADDVSSDRTQDIQKYIKNIKVVRNDKNLGFLLNCNNAAKEAKGEYIFFLNNDTNVQKNWLSSLLEIIENDSTVGMIGSKLVYPDGRQQEAGGIVWDDGSAWNYGRLDNPEKSEYTYVKEVDYISGAAIMIRSKLWQEIGGFDERYVPAYYEDTDLAFEVRKHGYKVMLQPKSVVVHFEGISHGTDTSNGLKQYQVLNSEKFYDKWKTILRKEHFPNAEELFLARDKSADKPHVLFVDHYLPHFDHDAGSKATLQYLKILTKAKMQIHFIGDNFWHYPDTPYLDTLTQMGIEVLYGNWYADHWKEWLRTNGKYFDYVILSRPHISVKYIDTIKDVSDAKIIYFGHDLHFLREEREYNIKKDKQYLRNSQYWKKIELDLMEKSDVSYFFSDIEQTIIHEYNHKLNVDVVPLYIYDKFQDINYKANKRKNIMFVGGFAHPANTDAVLWFVNEIWPSVQNELPDMHFYIIGSKPPKEILEIDDEHITVTGFISDEELNKYYANCKFMVAPLRFGAGVKGKVIDAMHNALPVVTTSIGAEGIQNATKFMKIADDSKTFSRIVATLYNDEKELEILSTQSLIHCKKYFSETYAKEKIGNIIAEFTEQ